MRHATHPQGWRRCAGGQCKHLVQRCQWPRCAFKDNEAHQRLQGQRALVILATASVTPVGRGGDGGGEQEAARGTLS